MVEEEDWDEAGRVRVLPELLAFGFSLSADFGLCLSLGLGRCFGCGFGFDGDVPAGRVRGAAA